VGRYRIAGTPPEDFRPVATQVRAGSSAYGDSKSEPRPTASGRVRDSTGRGTERMEAKKAPAKNDKAERNINDFAVDLMAAQRSCPICKRPLWKEKYDAVVKGHLSMDLEIEIAPEEIIPRGFCISAVVAPAAYSVS
jgi:hypothetical protein